MPMPRRLWCPRFHLAPSPLPDSQFSSVVVAPSSLLPPPSSALKSRSSSLITTNGRRAENLFRDWVTLLDVEFLRIVSQSKIRDVMRSHVACVQCRGRKRKCILPNHATACTNCIKTGQICSATKQPPRQSRTLAQATNSPGSAIDSSDDLNCYDIESSGNGPSLPEQSLCNELVELYCSLMHDKQHALFHRPSLIAEVRAGQAEPFLVLAMMAIVARFSQNPYFGSTELSERGKKWAEQSRRLFDNREVAVSLIAVQGCALLANLAFIQGDSAKESLYGAQQIRMVQLLGYPRSLSSDLIQREVEIRVWWTTWMMDTWTSTSMGLEKQLVYKPGYPRPMEEEAFELLGLQPRSEDPRESAEDTGLWSQMVPLTEVLAQVNQLNSTMVTHPVSQEDLFDQVRNLGSQLEDWQFCLPQPLQLTSENLQMSMDKGFGRILVALHLGYHYHSLQLYFQFLSFNEKVPKDQRLIRRYARKCKEHAMELSNLMWIANTTPGLECLWGINGHLLVVASAVHLHTLLFDEEEERTSAAKEMLGHNFELLLELQKYWPSLELSISRLRVFHRACLQSAHSTFNMNHWMLRFLQKYALAVEDQEMGPSPIMTPSLDDTASEMTLPPDLKANDILQIFL